MLCTTLDEYMNTYGGELAKAAAQACRPLHVPGRDLVANPPLLRPPYEAQAHVITATIKALERQAAVQISAEMGTGKTFISQAACQGHARGGYRALVFCPPHLCHKWERELRETLANVHVRHIETYKDLTRALPNAPAFGRGWWIISNTRAKMGPKWQPSFQIGTMPYRPGKVKHDAGSDGTLRYRGLIYCPRCGKKCERLDRATGEWIELTVADLAKKKRNCEHCGDPLWQFNHEIDRWPVAAYIHKHLPGWFDYLIIDESHQTKSADTAIGQAMGSLVASCKKTICLTGTLLGGYAWHVRPLLFRIAPRSLIAEGLSWDKAGEFDDRYGRIERKVTESESKSSGRDNKQSKGRTTSKTQRYVRPGVMPTLFGKHLIQNTVFLSLDEIADNLPRLDEEVIGVPMDPELAAEYERIEKEVTDAVKRMLQKRDKRLLSKMLHLLLGYPDHPYGWGEIGYYEYDEESGANVYHHVCTPKDLSKSKLWRKEKAQLDLVMAERDAGRRCWLYSTMTDKHDVNDRLRYVLAKAGLRVEVLRSKIETGEREQWIADHGPNVDAMVSHPQLVETGLDLFDKRGSYNFPTLDFYSTGYNLFTLRQASRRSWRIGQTLPCKVRYLHYEGTMQARALTLMGKKLTASASMEGKFSSEGLAALAGDEGSLETALAKSLVERLDDMDVGRAWSKLGQAVKPAAPAPIVIPAPRPPQQDDYLLPPPPKKQLDRHVSVSQLSLF